MPTCFPFLLLAVKVDGKKTRIYPKNIILLRKVSRGTGKDPVDRMTDGYRPDEP
jgi:hypothetical protein